MVILLVGCVISYTTYVTIGDTVAEQSRIQQQSLSPVFSLVNEQLLKPLHIAQTIGEAEYFNQLLGSPAPDEKKLAAQLKRLEDKFDFTFFAASEHARKQYFSDGRTLQLIEGDVYWYFEAIAQNRDLIADLGQVGDVHLFFDVKIYSDTNEFLGFVGVGKRLQLFLDKFNEYKKQYGYDFLFVDENQQIILTSLPDLVVTDAHIPSLKSIEWLQEPLKTTRNLNNLLVLKDGHEYLLSEIYIEELDWKLLLLNPLNARQDQITKRFISNTMTTIIVVGLLLLTFWIALFYKRRLEEKSDIDSLSGLPNRTHIQRLFLQLRLNSSELSVIRLRIDDFDSIGNIFGPYKSNKVIETFAKTLNKIIRPQDIAGRWGEADFIILIPSKSIETATSIAQNIRLSLELEVLTNHEHSMHLSASFGITHDLSSTPLSKLISCADEALAEAISHGKSNIECYEIP